MRIYIYNRKNLSYDRISTKQKLSFIFSILSISLLSFFGGTFIGVKNISQNFQQDSPKYEMFSKQDLNPEYNAAWKDSIFKDYAERAEIYLSRPKFKGTPLSAEMMTLCAKNAYDSTGVFLPVELALSQAYWETSMGLEGRSPKNNPFNIGEHDSGTVRWFKSTFEGTQAYYYYMCRTYLRCKTIDELFGNFVNCGGHRYASTPNYEELVRNQYYGIKKWINTAMKQK